MPIYIVESESKKESKSDKEIIKRLTEELKQTKEKHKKKLEAKERKIEFYKTILQYRNATDNAFNPSLPFSSFI